MSILCDSRGVSIASEGKLRLHSIWTSDKSGGEVARIEVSLAAGGVFTFVVSMAQTNVVAVARQIGSKTVVDIDVDYVDLHGDSDERLAHFTFRGFTQDSHGAEVEDDRRTFAVFLP